MRNLLYFLLFIYLPVKAQVDYLPILYSPLNQDTLHGTIPFFQWINPPTVSSEPFIELVKVNPGQQVIEAIEVNPKLLNIQLSANQTFFNSNSLTSIQDTGKYSWRICYLPEINTDNQTTQSRVCSLPFWYYNFSLSKIPFCELLLHTTTPKGFQVAMSTYIRVNLLTVSTSSIPILEISEEKSDVISTFEGIYNSLTQKFEFDLSTYNFKKTNGMPIVYSGRVIDPEDEKPEGYFRVIYQ
jgi:hypothetical protein